MKWEIVDNTPKLGQTRFKTRFAFFPTRVLNKITMTDHIVWLELYLEEQRWSMVHPYDGDSYLDWKTIAKTIHI